MCENEKVYIVVKEYSEYLSKRQPWYSIKKLMFDIESIGLNPVVVSNCAVIPNSFTGNVIKVFSLKDIFVKTKFNFKMHYFISFPIYRFSKFLSFHPKVVFENWHGLNRIFIMSLIPNILIKKTLKKAISVIATSDRVYDYLSPMIDTKRYYPFQEDNWGGANKTVSVDTKELTVGYFGPPYITRYFDKVIDFFNWTDINGFKYTKKIITRLERTELAKKEEHYLKPFIERSDYNLVSGFLDREDLANELMQVDVLILPFRIVMSELPIVVLEALELGIPVITTQDSGVETLTKIERNILVLPSFTKKHYKKIIEFIDSPKSSEFPKLLVRLQKINKSTLSKLLCQN